MPAVDRRRAPAVGRHGDGAGGRGDKDRPRALSPGPPPPFPFPSSPRQRSPLLFPLSVLSRHRRRPSPAWPPVPSRLAESTASPASVNSFFPNTATELGATVLDESRRLSPFGLRRNTEPSALLSRRGSYLTTRKDRREEMGVGLPGAYLTGPHQPSPFPPAPRPPRLAVAMAVAALLRAGRSATCGATGATEAIRRNLTCSPGRPPSPLATSLPPTSSLPSGSSPPNGTAAVRSQSAWSPATPRPLLVSERSAAYCYSLSAAGSGLRSRDDADRARSPRRQPPPTTAAIRTAPALPILREAFVSLPTTEPNAAQEVDDTADDPAFAAEHPATEPDAAQEAGDTPDDPSFAAELPDDGAPESAEPAAPAADDDYYQYYPAGYYYFEEPSDDQE